MKQALAFTTRAILSGLLIVIPIYLAILLLLKGMKSVVGLVHPLAVLLPDWVPAEMAMSLLLILGICFLVGVAVRHSPGASRAQPDRANVLREDPRLRASSEPHSADGRKEPREHLAAGTLQD